MRDLEVRRRSLKVFDVFYSIKERTMSKRKKNVVLHISSVENTLRQMPKYNPYQVGHGSHGDKGYNRRKNKEQLRKELRNEAL